MSPQIPSLIAEPIRFARGGASAVSPEHSLEAFRLAVRLGATGVESRVWATGDGRVVLRQDESVGRWRRRRLGSLGGDEVPVDAVGLAELYEVVGRELELCLDVGDPAAVGHAVAIATEVGALDRLWLRSTDRSALVGWHEAHPGVRVVWATALRAMDGGPERGAADLRRSDIDAVQLHHSEWTGGLTTLFHRFGRLAFASDAQHTRVARAVLHMGIDAVSSDHPDRLADAAAGRPGSDAAGP